MMATREQERQAIGMIRKTLETLGTNSWLGFAMDGVLEDAERNIEEDAAYSMKQRYTSAQEHIRKIEDKNAELRNMTCKQVQEIEKLREEIKMYRQKIQGMEESAKQQAAVQIPTWCAKTAMDQLRKEEEQIQEFMGVAADQMANYSLGLCGSESDEIKTGYLVKLKEIAEKHTQRKHRLTEIIEAEDQLQRYLAAMEEARR